MEQVLTDDDAGTVEKYCGASEFGGGPIHRRPDVSVVGDIHRDVECRPAEFFDPAPTAEVFVAEGAFVYISGRRQQLLDDAVHPLVRDCAESKPTQPT